MPYVASGPFSARLAMLALCAMIAAMTAAPVSAAEGALVQIEEDFAVDPGWEGYQNRVVAENPPKIKQDFGWSETDHTGAGKGELGGYIHRSLTMATYAMPIQPASFDTPLEAKGKIVIMPNPKVGGFYFGWFNQKRQGWRPWSSIAFRLGDYDNAAEVQLDYMASNWQAGGYRSNTYVPADGKPHTFTFRYEPEAKVDMSTIDPLLPKILAGGTAEETEVFEKAKAIEPGITREDLRRRLFEAEAKGQVGYYHKGESDLWSLQSGAEKLRGRLWFQLDDKRAEHVYLVPGHRELELVMDRFGIFNFQLYGRHWEFYNNDSGTDTEFYIGDLTMNGKKIDLSQDPGWVEIGNRVEFVDPDFHGRHDFGWSQTNWAGAGPSEIGGELWRNEVIDPMHAHYAVDVGELTLEDPISFSGTMAFNDGATDGDFAFGYFNKAERLRVFTGGERAVTEMPKERRDIHLGFDSRSQTIAQHMGISVGGPTIVGFYYSANVKSAEGSEERKNGTVIKPDGARHTFAFNYDPAANNGVGQVTFSLDDKTETINLTPKMRAEGATFDRLGFTAMRQGGKWVFVYIDDLKYTARYPSAEARPEKIKQEIKNVPYPKGGRFY